LSEPTYGTGAGPDGPAASATDLLRAGSLLERLHGERGAWVVLAISLLLTLTGWYIADSFAYQRAGIEYAAAREDVVDRIEERLSRYILALRSGVAFAESLERLPTRDEWRRYVATLEIAERLPGIQGYGLSLMLRPEELAAHEAAVQAEGFPDYRVRPEGERERYSAIVYLEPFDWRNQRAFGYDMYANAVRREAMDRAARTGEPAASGHVTLVQETDAEVQAGFLVYVPLFDPGAEDGDSAAAPQLIGYVYAPFRVDDLIAGALAAAPRGVAYQMFDGADENAGNLLYDGFESLPPAYRAMFSSSETMTVAGRDWHINFSTTPDFEARLSTAQPAIIATVALGIDALLFLILLSFASQRRVLLERAEAAQQELLENRRRLLRTQEVAGLAYWELDLDRGSLIGDALHRQRYGFDPRDSAETLEAWLARVHPEDRERTRAALEAAAENATSYRNEFRVLLPDGRESVMASSAYPAVKRGSRAVVFNGLERDVTERAHREQQLLMHASVFDNAREAIFITDLEPKIIAVNPAFTRILGYDADAVIGENPSLLQSGRHGPDFFSEFWDTLRQRGHWEGEIWDRHRDGEMVAGHLSVAAVEDHQGKPVHYISLFTDISQQKEQEMELQRLASYDPLTGLPNRSLLNDRMQQSMALARRNGAALAVCYMDLDGFKAINDRLGHDVGDELLIQVAGRLRQLLRGYDTASRLGGDEFLLLISNIDDVDTCSSLMQRVLEALSAPYLLQGHFSELSASIGVTLYPADDVDADTLIRHADQAMYRAKEGGRNRFEIFDLSMEERSRDYRERIAEVGGALATERLVLHYQPKVDMRAGTVYGVEALVRWDHPTRGLLYPGDFIDYLDDPLHFEVFGRWVLRTAMSQLREWRAQGLDMTLSVNISGKHLQVPDFVPELRMLLRQYPDVPPERLELEILETSALEDLEGVSEVICQCRDLGVRFAIDDFGTGYSSLVYLRNLQANVVKIDQTFVRKMLDNDEDCAIVEGVIRLAQVFDREVIAEGVETEAHGLELLRLGCGCAQGWFIAKAMPSDEFPRWREGFSAAESWLNFDSSLAASMEGKSSRAGE
jgi:diguanylate cyclase (GGDEF)-like protein/PAS domain S-box-containing protein